MSNVENNNEYSIIFSGVKKAYGKTVVIENLNLEIKKGERLILLGPSGCGKTTTLRMIAGFEEITSGDLFMDGDFAVNAFVMLVGACGEVDFGFDYVVERHGVAFGLLACFFRVQYVVGA